METISSYLLTFLLNAVWQIPLFTGVAMLATWTMRNGPSSHRHIVWVVALLASVVLPILSSTPVRSDAEPMPVTVPYTDTPTVASSERVQAQARPSPPPARRTLPYPEVAARFLVAAYVMFLLYRITRLIRAWIHTVRLQRSSSLAPASAAVTRVWERCGAAFHVSNADLRTSKHVSSPATAGAWRPSVILPEAMLSDISADLLTSAIGHEMAHVVRRDYACNLLYEVLILPIAFHPAAHWIARAVRQTRELACDELVTRRVLQADVYARSILEIAAGAAAPLRPDYMLGVFDGDILEQRIRRLAKNRIATGKRAGLLFATAISGLVLCAVFAAGSAVIARAQGAGHDEVKLAEAAYNQGDYVRAISHFQTAAQMEPGNIKNKLFLANALLTQFFKEHPTRQSTHVIAAQEQYEQVLAQEPDHKQAMHGLMGIAINTRRPADALELARKRMEKDPSDPIAPYTAAVAQWMIAYAAYSQAKAATGGRIDDYFIHDANVRRNLRDKHMAGIEDGLTMAARATNLKPEFHEAMAYTNLLLRLKGGIADTREESNTFIAEADEWVGRALSAKASKPQAPPAPPRLDVDGPIANMPTPTSIRVAPPPPPPPPPPPAR